MKSLIIISSTADTIETIDAVLSSEFQISITSRIEEALLLLQKKYYDIAFVDVELIFSVPFEKDYKYVLNQFWEAYPSIEIVIMASKEWVREAVKAVKAGAAGYLTHPIDKTEIALIAASIRKNSIKDSELEYLRGKFWKTESRAFVRTKNHEMMQFLDQIRIVAPTKSTVLITGETGTGKSLMAKLIHAHSNRAGAPFVAIHCGAIPDTLIESELFGHEKGAFTGADRKKLGKFEIAGEGTLFLDEIGTISPAVQIKLLQVLQDGTFNRVGSEISLESRARIIAATNIDLAKEVAEDRFRRDLFYRINVFPVELPPLRKRPEDIPMLVEGILDRLNREFLKNIEGLHPLVMEALQKYSWTGNIRELENLIERAYLLETSDQLMPDAFPSELMEMTSPDISLPISSKLPFSEARSKAIEDFERQYVKELLNRNRGRINYSAEEAGFSARHLHNLMLKYGIRKERFKRQNG
jgi:DNA-binding NtrC family response regulator